MVRRGGKIQFLFWAMFFAVLLYLWILWVGLQTFVLHEGPRLELPRREITLLFILYGLLVVDLLGGLVVAVMIGNRRYTRYFGGFVLLVFATIVAAKSVFG